MRALLALLLGIVAVVHAETPRIVSIPLYHVVSDGAGYRLGIEAALGGSPEQKLYMLDTGSTGLYAAYDRRWWGEHRPIRPAPNAQVYGSGIAYTAEIVETSVDFGGGAVANHVHIGRVETITGPGFTTKKWNAEVHANKPPLWGIFFGNMGSGLVEDNLMFAVLAQLPKPLSNGFVINTKGFLLHKKVGSVVPQGSVDVGVDDAVRSRFEIQIPMSALVRNGRPIFLPSGFRAREQYLINVHLTLSAPGLKPFNDFLPALLDTGAPNTTIHGHGKKRSESVVPREFLSPDKETVRKGVDFATMSAGDRGWKWGFEAGNRSAVNKVSVSADRPQPDINLGIEPYFNYEVMFDLERGVLGLHRIPRTPKIEVNGGRERVTNAAAMWLRGRATSSEGIASIQYRVNGSPRLRKVKGRAQWQIPVPLRPGFNWVRIKATSLGGATSQLQLIIRRD